ncbi:Gfo/Idh/MocA family oxidoreductase [Patescibacteria group bacterium]|nr:Gfo/Idh/MocA family oxidoreductase [Candidatus Falkowbacteria bacterium]MBU3905595.1 Gfo/Idh/MocA family oxidoreductase [Patescibacteria group bacterium]MBU4015788.1 Gfo/Idh/MocA family oxidoreductase [Patescibacteria group bacterium]MBU4026280.1 Gfo/Idh/MocA family oxidoreductase [Patescibacteria group bacterium]MBU4073066.1 Gfo/Idh/MocA family oxidoreductase [Patescibacteria group bacterium]
MEKVINKKIKVGIIGLGHQSYEDHIPAIKASQDVEFIGVVEKDKKKLKTFLKENKKIPGYSDIDKLIKNKKPDFVIIAVPHCHHYELAKQALSNKIHVLKEKPFAVSLKQAIELNKIALKNKVKIALTLQRRFNPIYSTFLQLIDKIGLPYYIDIKYTFFTNNPHDGWRGEKNLAGGGCLIDMGYHMIDLLIWYFGLPDKLIAETSSFAKENIIYDAEDTAQVIFSYRKKHLWGSMLISRVIPPKQEYFKVYGTRGIINLERGKIERYSTNGELQESLKRDRSWPSAAHDQIEYFIKVIKNEKNNISDPEFHFNHLAFIEAAYKSKSAGRYVNPHNILNNEKGKKIK